jgi:hypothetical protein
MTYFPKLDFGVGLANQNKEEEDSAFNRQLFGTQECAKTH